MSADRIPRYLTDPHPDEEYANAFAMALLMPADAVRQMEAAGMSANQMADVFGVPDDVMVLRLDRLHREVT